MAPDGHNERPSDATDLARTASQSAVGHDPEGPSSSWCASVACVRSSGGVRRVPPAGGGVILASRPAGGAPPARRGLAGCVVRRHGGGPMDDPRTPSERRRRVGGPEHDLAPRALRRRGGLGRPVRRPVHRGRRVADAGWSPYRPRIRSRQGSHERRAAGGVGPGGNARHMITTMAVEFNGPDEAVCDSYFLFLVDTHETPRAGRRLLPRHAASHRRGLAHSPP